MSESIPVEEFVKEYVRANKTAFGHDRSKTVGASEVGRCVRLVCYSKRGFDHDEEYVDENGFAHRGDVMEDNFTAPLLRAWVNSHGGELLWSGQADQRSFVGKKVALSATPDGLAIDVPRNILAPYGVPDIRTNELVLEMKSISPRFNKTKLPKFEHGIQTIAQIGMIRSATDHKPEFGAVIYVEADDYFNINVYPVEFNERSFKSLVKRASLILRTEDPNKMPPEGKMRGGSECGMCPYAKRCLGYLPFVPDDDPRAPTKAQVAKVEKAAKKVSDLRAKADAAKKKVSEAEGDLYLVLDSVKRNFVQGKGITVHAKKTSAQNRVDSKKLIALLKEKGATEEEIESCRSLTKEGTSLNIETV